MNTDNTNLLIESDLSYQTMSVLFKVHNTLGNKLQEKYYQRAIAIELKKRNIIFEQEKEISLFFEGQKIGKYFVDFFIENKIVLEVKTLPLLLRKDHEQILSYMNELKAKLGIIANFRTTRLTSQRYVL